jgi:dUTP pyrophosphatase
MKVKLKKLSPEAVIPKYSRDGDAGLDLTAIAIERDSIDDNLIIYNTGLAIEIPKGYYGQIVPRSSSYKGGQRLKNGVGIIDSNYRGEIKFMYTQPENIIYGQYNVGDRVGQLIILPYPQVEFEEVEELSDTNRGTGGFGSSGK